MTVFTQHSEATIVCVCEGGYQEKKQTKRKESRYTACPIGLVSILRFKQIFACLVNRNGMKDNAESTL